MKNVFLLALCGFVTGTLLARIEPAYGVDAFKKEFESKYVKKDAADGPEKELAEAVTKAKCNVCHVGMNKKTRNDYGKALAKLLKKTDAKNTAKIQEMLEKVAGEKSSASDGSSPTFGELIKQGKLPGGASAAPAAGGN